MEQVSAWHHTTFTEITTHPVNTQWELHIERRFGATTLLKRLIREFVSQGRDVCVLSHEQVHPITNMPGVRRMPTTDDEAPVTANTVLLIDGIIKWDPTRLVREAGGVVIRSQACVPHPHKRFPHEIRTLGFAE